MNNIIAMNIYQGIIIVLTIVIILVLLRNILDMRETNERYCAQCNIVESEYPWLGSYAPYVVTESNVPIMVDGTRIPSNPYERLASPSTVSGAYAWTGPGPNMGRVKQAEKMNVRKQIWEARNDLLVPGGSQEANQQQLFEDVEFSGDSA